MGNQLDYRVAIEGHIAVLGVLFAQPGHGLGSLVQVAGEEFGAARYEDVPEGLPVFVVVVYDQGGLRVGEDVANAAQSGEFGGLGFLVEDYVDVDAVVNEAYGDCVGASVGVSGGETGDAGFGEEAGLGFGERRHGGLLDEMR